MSRAYHNLTAHYNVYFNASESYKKGMKKLANGTKDDFSELLPVFAPVGKIGESPVSSDMDRAIKKCTKLITLHSITAKPNYDKGLRSESQKEFYNKREYNNWVDDAYLLIGKSHFNRYDMNLAGETFRHVVQEFPDQDTRYEASVWLVRTLIEEGELTQARLMLEDISANTQFPKKQKAFLFATYADCFIRSKQYPQAAEKLEAAIRFEKKKVVRTRYYYILAQLYQRIGNNEASSRCYEKVINSSPSYEMAFSAVISRAAVSGSSSAASVRSQLNKLLRDEKNAEYRDQIYYALGNLDLQAGNKAGAIDNYHKSARLSSGNDRQKSRSYLALADLYYQDRDYMSASAFYDSTMTVIDERFPNYTTIAIRAKNLKTLAENLNQAKLEDSVQLIARMSPAERNAAIDKVIANVVKEEERKREEENEARQPVNMSGDQYQNQAFAQQVSGNNWYFYNPTAKSFGRAEFQRKWGKRPLEDNWRRKNKGLALPSETEETAAENDNSGQPSANGAAKSSKKLNTKSREYYLQNIPMTDSALKASNTRLQEALYNAGLVYRNKLREPKKAIETFESLNQRYSAYPLRIETLNQLYELYREQGNQSMTDFYKNLIIKEFPQSVYASILGDPNYVQRMREKQQQVEQHYTDTYKAFQAGNMTEVNARCMSVLSSKNENPYRAHYALLNAMATGRLNGAEAYHISLEEVRKNYPGTEESKRAGEIIASLDRKPEIKQKVEEKKAAVIYAPAPKDQHLFVWFLPSGQGNANQLNFNIVNFNLDNYSSNSLNVATLDIDGSKAIVVGRFNSATEALNYFDKACKTPSLLQDVGSITPVRFIITTDNFLKLQADGDIGTYMTFFMKTYKR